MKEARNRFLTLGSLGEGACPKGHAHIVIAFLSFCRQVQVIPSPPPPPHPIIGEHMDIVYFMIVFHNMYYSVVVDSYNKGTAALAVVDISATQRENQSLSLHSRLMSSLVNQQAHTERLCFSSCFIIDQSIVVSLLTTLPFHQSMH